MDSILLAAAALLVSAPIVYFIFKKSDDENQDTQTTGRITLFAETSCKPVVEELVNAFQTANPNAHIEFRSGSEKEAFQALFNDTSRVVVMPRGLSEKEKQMFAARYFTPPSVEFAKDPKNGGSLVLFNNQAREGLGKSLIAFVLSEAGKKVVSDKGFEPLGKKTGLIKGRRKVA